MRILYAGDSGIGGPANYLLGALKSLSAETVHIPPFEKLSPPLFKKRFDAILLSDFPRGNASSNSQKALERQVEGGTGLLMVGGWGSFSGPFGGWRGSLVEKLLPVHCLMRDDRLNFPGGALIISKKKHPMFQSISFKNPPVICGLNRLRPKKNSRVILAARRIVCRDGSYAALPHSKTYPAHGRNKLRPYVALDPIEYPLLVIASDPRQRAAALATDLAPHWSGGLVDWGRKRLKLRVSGKIQIEVGDQYVRFVAALIRWLTRNRRVGGGS